MALWLSKKQVPLAAVPHQQLSAALQQQLTTGTLHPFQVVESVAISFAMVVRSALALSAKDAIVTAIVDNSLMGAAALATMRILSTSGASGYVATAVPLTEIAASSAAALAVPEITLGDISNKDRLVEALKTSHCCILGCAHDFRNPLIPELLNELPTPLHCLDLPMGISPNGERSPDALYASSTLSLGAPVLCYEQCLDHVGRVFVCDVGLPRSFYQALGSPCAPFYEQPVLQFFPSDK